MKKLLLNRFILGSTLLYILILPTHATAQISPGGLRTRVNGSAYATCTSGICAISGGSKTGPNLLQRFNVFDTRNGISKVKIDTQGAKNLLVGVTSESGTFINRHLTLSSPANLFWLSPGGIWVGNGAMVSNVNNLLFTTAIGMKIGGNTFHVFKTRISDLNSFNQSPDLNFADLVNPEKDIANLGLLGNGSIKFEGGQITVDRHLLINATAGSLSTAPGYGTKLHAGRSVWLSGHQIALHDVSITAGEPGHWGLVNVVGVPFLDATQQGSIQLNEAFFKGQQLWLTAGSISLNQSQLVAPKGWIQLIANNSSDPMKSLTIAGSVLDVSAYNLKDLSAPALSLGEKSLRLSYPSIGLLSKGNIQLSQNTLLNASLDISSFLEDSWSASNLDLNSISDRSGIVLLSAEGKIAISSSDINADSSNTKAGRIFLLANGIDEKGGITINHSKLLARNGAGDGEIFLNSLGGIKLNNSTIDVSSTRYPIFRGESSGLIDFRPIIEFYSVQPYVFRGGNINLNNISMSTPILINRSNLIATQSSTGGGLESPLINLRDVFLDGVEYVSQYGTFGNEDSFSIGIDYNTGGTISLASKGGVKIADSTLDASSGKYPYDYMAGKIIIFDESQSGVNLSQASLRAIAGSPRDTSIESVNPGFIFIQAKNNIKIDHSSFLANNENAKINSLIDSIFSPFGPFVSISSDLGAISFVKSNLEARYVNQTDFYSRDFTGINIFPDIGIMDKMQVSFNVDPITSSVSAPTENATKAINDATNRKYSELQVAYGIPTTNGFVNQNPNLSPGQFLPTNPVQFNHSLPSGNNQSVSILIDQNSASSQFLESQNRTLIQTTKALGLPSGSGKLRSIAELQQRLTLASKLAPSLDLSALPKLSLAANESQPKSINTNPRPYTPAIVHLQRNDEASGQTRITAILLTSQGEPISRSTQVARADLDGWIKGFQRQLSRRAPQPDPTRDPGEPLAKALLSPLLPLLRAQGVTALLLEVDRGLQAIPYGALPVEGRPLGDLFALTITPSLGLIELDPGQRAFRGQMLLAGASQFNNGLAPLPMVRQELQALAQEHASQLLLDDSFTPTALIDKALGSRVSQLHIATHANFLPGQTGVLYTPNTTLSLADLGRRLRSRNSSYPLDLISMSACLTALGDEQSELGFVGMALQAGARSGLGTLWEVDDTATAAFFIELYRFLKVGLTKDQALQATQQAFRSGQVRLQGDRLVGPDPRTGQAQSILVAGLSRQEQILFAQGLNHPYYWAGMILTGSPW
jgi:filamentous hemagglutinin family protein